MTLNSKLSRSNSETDSVGLAFVFEPSNFDTTGQMLVGRQAASEAFLKAIVQHGSQRTLSAVTPLPDSAQAFADRIAEWSHQTMSSTWIRPHDLTMANTVETLFRPGPDLAPLAWTRGHTNTNAFSLCGITHTTADHFALDAIAALAAGPLEPWDALVCTSDAVKTMVQTHMDDWQNYYFDKFGSGGTPKRTPSPALPVIPLGVDCNSFADTAATTAARKDIRAQLSASDDDVVVLYLGRLSHSDKANPLPLFVALEATAQRMSKKLHLVLAGWFPLKQTEDGFREAALAWAPSVKTTFIDGRDSNIRQYIRFAADIFASFPDNIQETFGLTPLEAMAAGLPIVASDWDGYRATVRDGIDGFLVPTWMPDPLAGVEISQWFQSGTINYDAFAAAAAQSVAVDIATATEAFVRLANDPALRKTMGEAGRTAARQSFDWPLIIKAYEDLWAALREERLSAVGHSMTHPSLPRPNPFTLFAGYPTHQISEETRLTQGSLDLIRALTTQSLSAAIARPLPNFLMADTEVSCLLEVLKTPQTVKNMIRLLEPTDLGRFHRTLTWLIKVGALIEDIDRTPMASHLLETDDEKES